MEEEFQKLYEEELRSRVKEMAKEYLGEQIKESNEKEDFKKLWESYNNVSKTRSMTAYELRRKKMRIQLYIALYSIFKTYSRQDACEELSKINNSISVSLKDLKEEKKFSLIKKVLKELKKYEYTDSNYEISELLSLMRLKNDYTLEAIIEEINSFNIRNCGIYYISNGMAHHQLKSINESIHSKVEKLELKPRFDK